MYKNARTRNIGTAIVKGGKNYLSSLIHSLRVVTDDGWDENVKEPYSHRACQIS